MVDRSLEGVDQWITKLVGFAAILPTLEQNAPTDQRETHALALELEFDGVLLNRIRRQLGAVPGPLTDEAYLRKWEREFKKSDVATRKGSDVSLGKHEVRVALGVVVAAALFITSWVNEGLSATMQAAGALVFMWGLFSFIAWISR